jgi:hypothetical protein
MPVLHVGQILFADKKISSGVKDYREWQRFIRDLTLAEVHS